MTLTEARPRGLATSEAIISAPKEIVWSLLAGMERWPQWNDSISRIRIDGPQEVGTTFAWTAGGARITSTLEEIDFAKRLVWSGRAFGVRAVHSWELKPFNNFTHIRTTETFEGPLASIFPRLMQKKVARALDRALSALKAEAENQNKAKGRS